MERLWADSSGQDSYDPYTCAVNNALFLECLDIAGPRTLGNSLSSSVAYNMSGSSGDLNKNFYAVLALEGLVNMTGGNVTSHFGGDVSCSGKVVGDGAVNAYDMATIMWYQFKFEPYDQLSNDPSAVVTVQGRDDTGFRCNLGETRRMWQLAVGEDYCHSGQNAALLGYDSGRRLLQALVPEQRILSANLFEAYRSESVHPKARKLDSQAVPTSFDERETRSPSARRSSINRDDMLRHVNSMRTLDVDVAEWAVVQGYGRWLRVRAPGVQVAMELYLAGISVDEPVHLSLQSVPTKNCTTCKPVDEDPRKVVVAFARRTEYEDEYANALSISEEALCANIVPATVQSSVMLGNTIALRQQPPNRACGFDLFLWIPAFPDNNVHVSKHASPYSFSARRLAAVGAESALMSSKEGCDNDIGVLAGSSAMDGFRGQIQRVSSCTRYGFTRPDVIKPAVTTAVVPVEQCPLMACNAHAPTRTEMVSRSFNPFASSGLESAYSASLQMLSITPGGKGQALASYTAAFNKYVAFESMLARESQGNDCCSGYVCTSTIGTNETTGTCQLQPEHEFVHDNSSLTLASPPTSPSSPPPMALAMVFGVTVAGTSDSFNEYNFKVMVSQIANVSIHCITVEVVHADSLNVTTTIRPTYTSSMNLFDVKDRLEPVFQNESKASNALGVTVENIFATPDVHWQHYAPPPTPATPPEIPPPVPDKDDNVGLIIGFSLGGAALLVFIMCVVMWNSIGRAQTSPERQGLNQQTTSARPAANYAQYAYTSALPRNAKADEHSMNLAKAFATSVGHSSSNTPKVIHKAPGKVGPQRNVQNHHTSSIPLLKIPL